MFHKMGRTGIPLPARLLLSRFTSDQDCVTFLFVDYMSRLGGGPIRQPSIMMIWSKKYFSCFLFSLFGFFLSCQMIWLRNGHRVGGLTIVFQVLRPSCWFLTRHDKSRGAIFLLLSFVPGDFSLFLALAVACRRVSLEWSRTVLPKRPAIFGRPVPSAGHRCRPLPDTHRG
jgi:hypothetical protein